MPMIDMLRTGANIRSMREENHMTVNDVAIVCGISKTAVYKWQAGTSVPTVDNLVILSSVWNVSIDNIIIRA